jgi:hypothetical protein
VHSSTRSGNIDNFPVTTSTLSFLNLRLQGKDSLAFPFLSSRREFAAGKTDGPQIGYKYHRDMTPPAITM